MLNPALDERGLTLMLVGLAVMTAYAVAKWRGWDRAYAVRWVDTRPVSTRMFLVSTIWVMLAFDMVFVPSAILRLVHASGQVENAVGSVTEKAFWILFGLALYVGVFERPWWALPPWFREFRASQRST